MSGSSPEQADHASIPQGRVHQLLVRWLKNTQIWNVIRLKGCYSPSDWTASASVSVEKILLGRYKAGSDAILLYDRLNATDDATHIFSMNALMLVIRMESQTGYAHLPH